MDFKNLKKQVKETIEIQKMINDIKHTLNRQIFDGYSPILDKIRFDRTKRNIFIKGNLKGAVYEKNLGLAYECVFNIVFDKNMHISDLTYDSDEQCLDVTAHIATDLLGIVKEYFNQKIDLSPVRVDFVKLHDDAVRALELGEAHLFNVKDENTTTPESVIHGFEKDNKLFVSDPGKFL